MEETDKEADFRSSQRRTMIELVPWEHTSPQAGEASRKRRCLNSGKIGEEEVARGRGVQRGRVHQAEGTK